VAEPLIDRLTQAIADPGSIIGRRLGPSWGEGQDGYAEEQETVPRWSARAVEAVLREVERNGRYAASIDIKNMPITLGDEGWGHLADQAEDAGYDRRVVTRRRRPETFTTLTVEAAYQYGYRQAAKVAQGEVDRG